jgi:hypothetical protein
VHSTPEPETDFKSDQGDDDMDSDVSESYTPLPSKTKSGRSVNKPTQYVPVIPEAKPEGKKRRPYRRNIEAAVCKMCNRGTSPSTNQIVFCDGCGTPYHQYCHDPPIEADVVDIPDKEWFCSTCVKSKESTEEPNAEGLVRGDGLSAEDVSFIYLPERGREVFELNLTLNRNAHVSPLSHNHDSSTS